MPRLVLIPALLCAALGCVPGKVYLPEPLPASQPTAGPSVRLIWPTDLRPPAERGDGTNNLAFTPITLPLPVLYYGDPQLRPSPETAVWRGTVAALADRGVPIVEHDPDLSVRIHLLNHRGHFDISDASWVSTLTGGTAGKVGSFFYPVFADVLLRARVEVWNHRTGEYTVRDIEAQQIERRSLASTWGIWSFWQRSITTEMFQRAFTAAHQELAAEAAAVIDEARARQAPTAGEVAASSPLHAVKAKWSRADSIALRGDSALTAEVDAFAEAKYGAARFSMLTGHDTHQGDAIGQIALPIDTLAYHVGLTDHQQLQIDLTVLGVYNSFGGGLRTHLLRRGSSLLSAQARGGAYITLTADERYRPQLAGFRWGTSLMWSHRPADITWFVSAGLVGRNGLREVEALSLTRGAVLGLSVRPGFEYQLTSTALVSLSLQMNADFQNGSALSPGPLGRFVPVPVVAIGLR